MANYILFLCVLGSSTVVSESIPPQQFTEKAEASKDKIDVILDAVSQLYELHSQMLKRFDRYGIQLEKLERQQEEQQKLVLEMFANVDDQQQKQQQQQQKQEQQLQIFQKTITNLDTLENGIGFTAKASLSRSYSVGQIIIFDSVVTNIGGHYNSETSIFTCPAKGTYLFSVSIRSQVEVSVDTCIMHEGNILTGTATLVGYGQGSATAIVDCAIGERVWIELVFASANAVIYGHNSGFTAFSGVLIKQT